MIIYNVTVKIEHEVHEDWLKWMKTKHIPDVMETGYFTQNRLCRVMSLQDDDGVTYAIQYDCASTAVLHKYQVNAAPALQKEHKERYEGKFVAFRTLMEVVE